MTNIFKLTYVALPRSRSRDLAEQRKQRDQDRPAHPRSQTTASAVINIRNLRTSISPVSGQRKPDAQTDSGSDVIKYVYMNGNGSRLDGGGGGGGWGGGGRGGGWGEQLLWNASNFAFNGNEKENSSDILDTRCVLILMQDIFPKEKGNWMLFPSFWIWYYFRSFWSWVNRTKLYPRNNKPEA